jgi:hypothetical protein
MTDEFKFLFMLGAGVLTFLFYFVSIHFRRLRYRKIAEELGAEYQSQGLFKTGEIAGSNNGRKFSIATKDTGGGRGSSNSTTISIHCANKGMPFLCMAASSRLFLIGNMLLQWAIEKRRYLLRA